MMQRTNEHNEVTQLWTNFQGRQSPACALIFIESGHLSYHHHRGWMATSSAPQSQTFTARVVSAPVANRPSQSGPACSIAGWKPYITDQLFALRCVMLRDKEAVSTTAAACLPDTCLWSPWWASCNFTVVLCHYHLHVHVTLLLASPLDPLDPAASLHLHHLQYPDLECRKGHKTWPKAERNLLARAGVHGKATMQLLT